MDLPDQAGDGADQDQVAPALGHQVGDRGAQQVGRGAQVEVDEGVDVVGGHVPEGAAPAGPGVGDDDVEAAEGRRCLGHQPGRVPGCGQVAGERRPPGLGGDGRQGGGVATGQGHGHAVGGQGPGRGRPDPARGPGDQGPPAPEGDRAGRGPS